MGIEHLVLDRKGQLPRHARRLINRRCHELGLLIAQKWRAELDADVRGNKADLLRLEQWEPKLLRLSIEFALKE